MLAIRLIPIVLVAPLLCAASNEQPDTWAAQPARDRRRALETYVEQLADLLEKQTQNVASIAPFGELVKLQMEHGAWKLERDLRCAEEDEGEAVRIRELECIAELSELHFEHRQRQTDEIKNQFGSRPRLLNWKPYVLKPPEDISELPGNYYRGDGKGYNVSLDLKLDQTYSAIWDGCLGEYGRSSGTWSLKDGRVLFRPTEEFDMMKGHLTELVVGYQDEILFLFPDPNDDSFPKYMPSRSSVFSRRNEKFSEQ